MIHINTDQTRDNIFQEDKVYIKKKKKENTICDIMINTVYKWKKLTYK